MKHKLDEYQEQVVTSTDEHILVIAGSGSGKTRVLTERIKFLLNNGADPADIVAITFTNMAAEEMRERLGDIPHLFVGTIHAYANQILMKNGIPMETWQNAPREDHETQFDILLKMGTKKANTVSLKFLLVDEFQDIGDLEYDFFEAINAKNTFFVGDDWQAIYHFKGGRVDYFFELIGNPQYKKYYLSNNYRTGSNILAIAEKEIAKVRQKVNKNVVVKSKTNGFIEKMGVQDWIAERKEKQDFGDWFFLVRTNPQLADIESLLMEDWIPYVTFKKGDTTLDGMNLMLEGDSVKLLTIHSAKGLESPKVAIVGMRSWNDDELRVNYVGLTRAKDNLVLIQ